MPLYLRPPRPGKSPNWEIRGSYIGKRIEHSTGTPDKKTAAKILARIKDEIERGSFAGAGEPTFAGAALKYIQHGGERRFVMKLAEWFGSRPLAQITQAAVDEAAIALYPHATPATRNRQVYSPVSAILKHAGHSDPLRRPKGGRGGVRHFFFTPEQAAAVIAAGTVRDPEYGIFLIFLLYTGARLSEALAIKVESLRLSEATAFAEHTKNGEPRMIHLPPPLVAALAGHPRGLERRGKLFRFGKCGRLYMWLTDAAQAAGVAIPDGVAYHAFRHTYGAWMRRYCGLDTTGLVKTGAWKSRESASRYEHAVTTEEARKADGLPNVLAGKRRGK